ncbi:putative disease resistance protein At3g14460 isoform X1 [Arachis stenosperma]|uniref:putative disease resistance protein At3g14460 isoform X1 n=1 Tax=Arachis stenosperma TaxID=217475 RepID=UPI0025AB646B|nr:putative disease resistance protein At3g14460 isoform X1 [Arachis stenosperma]XP_057741979.1 putative disease resistance protein At3g14460 isoform X1 [Arachis stenosperma]
MKGFDLKAWVCVSANFDIIETTENILKEILGDTFSVDDFNSPQYALKEELWNKKFFIVLDDVFSVDGDKWSNFMTPFQYGNKGSIVLLITQEENVVSAVKDCRPYFLNELSDDNCWSVFAENASFPESNGNKELESIGREIVKKCDGVPLVAGILGGLFRTRHDVDEWNKILRSAIWEFPVAKSKIIPALLISYFHLPADLKPCFLYCSLFPKGYFFHKDELILLWMAEDILQPPKRGYTLEEIGCKYFDELISRLFFKRVQGQDNYFVMHNILHDLAISLAGDYYCNLKELGEEAEIGILTQHLSFGRLNSPNSKILNSVASLKSLRTSLYVVDLFSMRSIASKLNCLRVLSFYELDVLPDLIGSLIHLHYLNLSWTNIKTLPESLCNLYSLQTLKLCECIKLTMLPRGMHKLVNLRHLDVRKTPLKEMPGGISKLKELQFLSDFVVGRQEENGIRELGGLSNLHGSLGIQKLENVVDANQARSAGIDKKHIDELLLKWSSDDDMVLINAQTEIQILDSLKPHNGLKELRIWGYKGPIFPDWLGHCYYENMTSVSLLDCKNCFMLPSLGHLPSLKSLRIQGFDQLRSIGEEFYKNEAPFPSLETLELYNMPWWEEWHFPGSETFPRLRKLQLRNCPMLKGKMLNAVFWGIVLKVPEGRREMILNSDTFSIKAMSINNLSYLQEIHISRCRSPLSFPDNCLPKSLQKLTIMDSRMLEFPQQQPQIKHDLVELQIQDSCDSLTSLSLDSFPKLKNLEISLCRNLESVSMSDTPHASLQRLTINGCHKLVSFAGEGLAAPNLTHLSVTYCDKLEAFPSHKNAFPSLHSLCIQACQKMCKVPEGGLPPNLKELVVEGSDELMKDLSWMANLVALTELTLDFCCVRSCTQVGLLPQLPSLTSLHLCYFQNLETLECNKLFCLTSLQQLHISYCPKLENMEGEELPPSLLLLTIEDCGLLGEHCKNKHQLIWPKIAHIPTIQVNGQQIS